MFLALAVSICKATMTGVSLSDPSRFFSQARCSHVGEVHVPYGTFRAGSEFFARPGATAKRRAFNINIKTILQTSIVLCHFLFFPSLVSDAYF